MEPSLGPAIKELERAYAFLNKALFDGQLTDQVIITIQTRGKTRATAWYRSKAWQHGPDSVAEINLCGENLAEPPDALAGYLLHAMVHARNDQRGVRDCPGHQYHNRQFRDLAQKVGLVVRKTRNRGFADTEPGPLAREKFSELELRVSPFEYFRCAPELTAASRGRSRNPDKWSCGCPRSFWACVDMSGVMCTRCERPFILQAAAGETPDSETETTPTSALDAAYAHLIELPSKKTITRAELAEIFGKSPKTIRRWVAKGDLPQPARAGRSSFWTAGEILDHIRKRQETATVRD